MVQMDYGAVLPPSQMVFFLFEICTIFCIFYIVFCRLVIVFCSLHHFGGRPSGGPRVAAAKKKLEGKVRREDNNDHPRISLGKKFLTK